MVSSDEQEMTSQQLLVQSDSDVVVTFTQEADTVLDASGQMVAVENVSAISKASSGYHMALGMVRGEVGREGGVGVTLPTSKHLLEVRQRKKVRMDGLIGEHG